MQQFLSSRIIYFYNILLERGQYSLTVAVFIQTNSRNDERTNSKVFNYRLLRKIKI